MNDNKPPRLFHYTYAHKLGSILRSDGLVASKAGARVLDNNIEVDRKGAAEKRILWFSSNRSFEPTAVKKTMKDGKLERGNFLDHAKEIGLVRFELMPQTTHEVLSWKELPAKAGITHSQRQKMEKLGRAQGANPSEWFGIVLEDGTLFLHHTRIQRLDVSGEKPVWKAADLHEEIARFENIGLKVKSI